MSTITMNIPAREVELDAKAIGLSLAHAFSDGQAEVLNYLGASLEALGSHFADVQCCEIARNLDDNGAALVRRLAAHLHPET